LFDFVVSASGVVLTYRADQRGNGWVWRDLRDHKPVTLTRVFTFERRDLIAEPDERDGEDDFEGFLYQFRFAVRRDAYFHIEGRIFDIDNPVFIAEVGLKLERKVFVAERNISIFGKIAELIAPNQPIIIGGSRAGAIPIPDFRGLLSKFPNTGELNRYAAARVANEIGDYITPLREVRAHYEEYLNRRRSIVTDAWLAQPELLQMEIEKYVFIRDSIAEWLRDGTARAERVWQNMIINFLLLIFPKYVLVLSNVKVPDAYSTPGPQGTASSIWHWSTQRETSTSSRLRSRSTMLSWAARHIGAATSRPRSCRAASCRPKSIFFICRSGAWPERRHSPSAMRRNCRPEWVFALLTPGR
jgi:hypothetical protein